jgi:hypothetical protein
MYRGDIAIHSARLFPESARQLCLDEPLIAPALARRGLHVVKDGQGWSHNLPLGAVLAVVRLVDCVRTRAIGLHPAYADRLTAEELAFGDYRANRWAWVFADIRLLDRPLRCRGARALWDIDPALAENIAQLLP